MARSGERLLGFRRVTDSGERSNCERKRLFHWAQVYLPERFGVGQECASEASPLIVPASCRRAHVAERAQSAQMGFFLGAAKRKGVFNLVIPIRSAGPDLALAESETIRTKCGHLVLGIICFAL